MNSMVQSAPEVALMAIDPDTLPRYVAVGKAAELAGVSRQTIYDWEESGKLRPVAVLEVGKAEWRLYSKREVLKLTKR